MFPPCHCPQVELSDGTSHTITDAYAGKEYIIQVAAKDNDIGTWSDWSVAVHATPWTEEPKHLTTEAQITGETPSSQYKQSVPMAVGETEILDEVFPYPAPCKCHLQPRRCPPHPVGLQPFILHFTPTHGLGSRCNHGPGDAD